MMGARSFTPGTNAEEPAVTHPLTGRRSHSDLIAELYDRHATGLFAYCHDQLGDPGSAADALVAVFTGLPPADTPRAVLYTLARREITRRDVVYRPPAVDALADPATALIERVFRGLRPHQREVLLLSAVCGLTTEELAWVLDVAVDTAKELAATARSHFAQCLSVAIAQASSAAYVPPSVAEVYGAITVAPIEDVLARLPWRRPSAAVLSRILNGEAGGAVRRLADQGSAAQRAPGPVKPLWPVAPVWPLPLAEPDEITGTTLFPAAVPPRPAGRSPHEASTEPMPRLRGPAPSTAAPAQPAPAHAAPVPEAPAAAAPAPQAATAAPAAAPETTVSETAAPETVPEATTAQPATTESAATETATSAPAAERPATPAVRKPDAPRRGRRAESAQPEQPIKPIKERHYDWLWELGGFLICVIIAMLVFFAMPMLVP